MRAFVSAMFRSLIPSSSPATAMLLPLGLKATQRTGSMYLFMFLSNSSPGILYSCDHDVSQCSKTI